MVRLCFLVCAVVLLGVCNGAVAEGDDPPVAQGSRLRDTGRCADDVSERGQQAPEEPTGPLTLAKAIELVVLKSPYLEAFSWDVRAAEAHMLQAGLRRNPEFSVQTDEVRRHPGPEAVTRSLRVGNTIEARKRIETPERSGFSDAEIALQLSQVIELGRKRAKRAQLAETECSVAAWDYEVAKAEVLAQMTKDFAEVLALQEHLQLAEERIRCADEALAKLSVHIKAGALTVKELNEGKVQRAEAETDREGVRRGLDAARVRLASAWGSTQPGFDRVEGQLDAIAPIPSEAELLQRIEGNSEIARWAAEIDARRAAVSLEKANAVPDVDAAITFKTDRLRTRHFREVSVRPGRLRFETTQTAFDQTRDNTVMLEFSIPLPLFDRNQGAIREARCLMSSAEASSRAANVRVRSEVLTLHATLSATYAKIKTLENDVIAATSETVDAVTKGVQIGVYTYFDLLDAMQDLENARQERLDALLVYHQTAADLGKLLGGSLVPNQSDTCPAACR